MSGYVNPRDEARSVSTSASPDSVVVIQYDDNNNNNNFHAHGSIETVDIVNEPGDNSMVVDAVEDGTQAHNYSVGQQEAFTVAQRDLREQSADIEFSDAELDYLASK